jgi:hypothetical protein
MADRRSHPRFSVLSSWDGAVQLLRDVTIVRRRDRELTMICDAPAAVDEMMTLDLRAGPETASLKVRVVDSKPILVGDRMRHEVRLEVDGGVVNGTDFPVDAARVASA